MKKSIILFSALALIMFAFSVFAQPKLYITSYCDARLESCKAQDNALELLQQNNPYDIHTNYVYYFDITDPQSSLAHIALECANRQEMKGEYKTELQNNLDVLTLSALKQYAENVGLNSANFTFCLDTQMTAWDVLEQVKQAEEKGVTTAPTILFNTDLYEGSQTLTSLKALAEEYLQNTIVEIQIPVEEPQQEEEQEEIISEEITETPEEQPAEQGQEELEQIEEPLFYRAIRQIRSWMLNLFQ